MMREQRLSLIKARAAAQAVALRPTTELQWTTRPSPPKPRPPRAPRAKQSPEELAAKSRARGMRRRELRLAAGACALCGGEKPTDRTTCDGCRADIVQKKHARREARKAAGLCPRCGDPAAPGGKLCDPHRRKVREAAREERGYVREYGPRRPRDGS